MGTRIQGRTHHRTPPLWEDRGEVERGTQFRIRGRVRRGTTRRAGRLVNRRTWRALQLPADRCPRGFSCSNRKRPTTSSHVNSGRPSRHPETHTTSFRHNDSHPSQCAEPPTTSSCRNSGQCTTYCQHYCPNHPPRNTRHWLTDIAAPSSNP